MNHPESMFQLSGVHYTPVPRPSRKMNNDDEERCPQSVDDSDRACTPFPGESSMLRGPCSDHVTE